MILLHYIPQNLWGSSIQPSNFTFRQLRNAVKCSNNLVAVPLGNYKAIIDMVEKDPLKASNFISLS